MMMIQQHWNEDDVNYVSYENHCCLQRKSDILPVTWNSDRNNYVGRAKLSHRKKVSSDDICNDLCTLMEQVKVKAHPSTDNYFVPAVFHSSFVVEPKCSFKGMEDMVSTRVNIEYYREIVDAIVDEYS